MAQEPEKKTPEDAEPAAASAKAADAGGGIVGRLAGYLLQFAMMVAAVLVAGLIAGRMHGGGGGGDDESEAEAPAAAEHGKPEAAAKPAKKGAARKEAMTPARYFAIDPPVVVNLSDAGAPRYLQVNVEVMARDEKVIVAVQQNVPLIRNDLVQLLSDRSPEELMSREGREKARGEAQVAVNNILDRESGGARIESLLFTGFVVQ